MRYYLSAALFTFVLALAAGAGAKIHTENVEYMDGDTVLEGYLAYDDSITGARPGVAIVHEWWGINDYVRRRAEDVAKLGYVAFAVDMYGKGIRPKDAKEAGVQAGIYRSDRKLMRRRVNAGVDVLKANRFTDKTRVAAMGYCFGGGTVLELARSGADIAGVASFHGNLDTPDPGDAKDIKAKVLALHGADDPFVPVKQVSAFEDEMRAAHVDWQLNKYGNAVHSFTNPASGNDPSKGLAYNSEADRRSWEDLKLFLGEIFTSRSMK